MLERELHYKMFSPLVSLCVCHR